MKNGGSSNLAYGWYEKSIEAPGPITQVGQIDLGLLSVCGTKHGEIDYHRFLYNKMEPATDG